MVALAAAAAALLALAVAAADGGAGLPFLMILALALAVPATFGRRRDFRIGCCLVAVLLLPMVLFGAFFLLPALAVLLLAATGLPNAAPAAVLTVAAVALAASMTGLYVSL